MAKTVSINLTLQLGVGIQIRYKTNIPYSLGVQHQLEL